MVDVIRLIASKRVVEMKFIRLYQVPGIRVTAKHRLKVSYGFGPHLPVDDLLHLIEFIAHFDSKFFAHLIHQ